MPTVKRNIQTGDQATRHASIEQGRYANVALSYMNIAISSLEERVISKLVAKYRSGILSDEDLRGSIGELAGYRNVLLALKGDVQAGNIAQEEEMKDGR